MQSAAQWEEWTRALEYGLNDEETLFRRAFALFEYDGFLSEGIPEGYLEEELSCFTGPVLNPTGLLLVHRCPSGRLSVEYCSAAEKKEEWKKLLGHGSYVKLEDLGSQEKTASQKKLAKLQDLLRYFGDKNSSRYPGTAFPPERLQEMAAVGIPLADFDWMPEVSHEA